MIFRAYVRTDGAFVLTPECLMASREAQARHGPLTPVGRVDSSCVEDPAAWSRVLADIDRQSYAVVRSSFAAVLDEDDQPPATARSRVG